MPSRHGAEGRILSTSGRVHQRLTVPGPSESIEVRSPPTLHGVMGCTGGVLACLAFCHVGYSATSCGNDFSPM